MSRICVDGFNIGLAKGSGIATYGRNLVKNLQEIGHQTHILYGPSEPRSANAVVNETALIAATDEPPRISKNQRFYSTIKSQFGRSAQPVPPTNEVIWPQSAGNRPDVDLFWSSQNLFFFANRCFSAYGKATPLLFDATSECPRPDIMHWTTAIPIYARDTPNIYTIHDLIPLKLPHTTLGKSRDFMKLCQFVAKNADQIATVSETSKRDIINILGVDEDRITTTFQSVKLPESVLGKNDEDVVAELSGIFGLEWKGYFIHFAAIEPKKNLARIVEAFLSSGSSRQLIIIGGKGWLQDGETALLNQVKKQGGPNADRIIQYEYLPYSLLMSLVRGARATIFPSLYEGFGLPILESMALGTAVLTSTTGSLPEVSGTAAYLADPYNVDAIKEGIRVLDNDDEYRHEVEKRGLIQSAVFSEAAYQDRLIDLYSKVR